ncbi:MAG TPA: S53 family peptidase [Ktedonobacterales bacterium]
MRKANWRGGRAIAVRSLVVAALVVLAGCASGGATGASSRSGALAATSGMVRLGATDPSRALTITLVLRGQAAANLGQTVAGIGDPASPLYRHFLTPAQFAGRFGAPASAVSQVETVLRQAGLRVLGLSGDGLQVQARGTAGAIEQLFGVRLADYRARDGRRFYAPSGAPRLPEALRGAVSGVLGLDDVAVARPAGIGRAAAQGDGGYSPSDLATAYDFAPLRQAGLDGSGQTIAFAEIDTFQQSDIDAYDNAYHISAPKVQVVSVAGGASPADKVSETTLDIEVVHAVAPQTQLIAYEGGGDTASLAQLFSQIMSDHRASIVSISLGLCEQFALDPTQAPSDLQSAFTSSGQTFFTALDTSFQEADALGISVLVASGDTGAYGCNQFDPTNHQVSPSAPATSPYVTAVGGTALFTGANGAYGREYGWEGPLEGAGGGGGLSLQYPRPTWQTGPGVANQFSNGMRQVPDVAADADPLTGYAIYDSTSGCSGSDCWGVVGGTSAAAPLWAGLIALINQQGAAKHLKPAGFLNPLLYQIGAAGDSGGGTPAFHDVAAGGNLYYPATPGWDFSTGWGTPDASVLAAQMLAAEQGG